MFRFPCTASIVLLSVCTYFTAATPALAGFDYQAKAEHPGGNLTPPEAHDMVRQDPENTFLVDIRTRPEYQFVGHPTMAYHVPFKVWTGRLGPKGYEKEVNPAFGETLLSKFDPKRHKLLFICRSGKRSCAAVAAAIRAGFPAESLFNVMGGFEGDKLKNEVSALHGQRVLGGWRNEGLPWTYSIEATRVYPADLETEKN